MIRSPNPLFHRILTSAGFLLPTFIIKKSTANHVGLSKERTSHQNYQITIYSIKMHLQGKLGYLKILTYCNRFASIWHRFTRESPGPLTRFSTDWKIELQSSCSVANYCISRLSAMSTINSRQCHFWPAVYRPTQARTPLLRLAVDLLWTFVVDLSYRLLYNKSTTNRSNGIQGSLSSQRSPKIPNWFRETLLTACVWISII